MPGCAGYKIGILEFRRPAGSLRCNDLLTPRPLSSGLIYFMLVVKDNIQISLVPPTYFVAGNLFLTKTQTRGCRPLLYSVFIPPRLSSL